MHKLYWRLLMEERGVLLLGLILSVITAFAGTALLAVSGWFISAAALAGLTAATAHAFNFFTPGAIVRGLSIARTAGRYGERLANHETTFRLIAKLRTQMRVEIKKLHQKVKTTITRILWCKKTTQHQLQN